MSIRTANEEAQRREGRVDKWDRRFMAIAEQVSLWSKDPGTKVGAVLVSGNVIVATGYNGLPRHMADSNLTDRDSKLSRTIHAEMNAMLNAMRQGASVAGCTLYVTPLVVCDRCAVHMVQAGIARVVVRPLNPLNEYSGESEVQWHRNGQLALRYFAESGVVVKVLEGQ
jgi:dCMP deaminase